MVPSVVMYAVSRALPQLSSPMSSSVATSRANSCADVSTTPARMHTSYMVTYIQSVVNKPCHRNWCTHARTHAQNGRAAVDGGVLTQEAGSKELVLMEWAFGQGKRKGRASWAVRSAGM